ncbi:MAG: PepSY-like domain-containing protein [Cytophaga sp.]|uniref:PepSY-like domain-containing protein n=1 Tax=Cytophaga sp. TaxID=29535 RepID=UPI003F807304
MKNLSIALLILSSGCISYAQEVAPQDVPAVVVTAFQQKFPQQAVEEWELKKGLYEAEFEISNMDHTVYIDSTGKIVKHKQEIPVSELPAAVTASIQKSFNGYKTEEAKKVEAGSVVTYKVELEKGEEERKVTFAADGKIIENKAD